MAKKTNYYFDTFIQMIDYSCQAADYLHETLQNFTIEALPERRTFIHNIEHTEDTLRHEMMSALAKEFVTPIEREDIIEMGNRLDTLTDLIEDVLIRIYMYNITTIRKDAIALSDVVVRSCYALKEAMLELPNFRKSTVLHDHVVKVNDLEDEGDVLYISAIHNLFSEKKSDPVNLLTWAALYDCLEDCCDACVEVVDTMEMIIMKNS